MPPQEEKQNREAEIKRANAELLAKFSEHVKQFEVRPHAAQMELCGHSPSMRVAKRTSPKLCIAGRESSTTAARGANAEARW